MFTYRVSGTLACEENKYPIQAEGSRNAAWAITTAMHEAVEQAVVQMARQSELLVEKCDNSGSSRLDSYEELSKLEELRRDGIITDEEFEAEKKKILKDGN